MLLHGGITPIKAFQVPLRGRARVNKNGLFVCETLEQWQSCDTSENNGGTYFHFFIFSIFVNVPRKLCYAQFFEKTRYPEVHSKFFWECDHLTIFISTSAFLGLYLQFVLA